MRREQERAENGEVFVVAVAEGFEKRAGLAGTERHADRVARPDERGSLGRGTQPGLVCGAHGGSLRPDFAGAATGYHPRSADARKKRSQNRGQTPIWRNRCLTPISRVAGCIIGGVSP